MGTMRPRNKNTTMHKRNHGLNYHDAKKTEHLDHIIMQQMVRKIIRLLKQHILNKKPRVYEIPCVHDIEIGCT